MEIVEGTRVRTSLEASLKGWRAWSIPDARASEARLEPALKQAETGDEHAKSNQEEAKNRRRAGADGRRLSRATVLDRPCLNPPNTTTARTTTRASSYSGLRHPSQTPRSHCCSPSLSTPSLPIPLKLFTIPLDWSQSNVVRSSPSSSPPPLLFRLYLITYLLLFIRLAPSNSTSPLPLPRICVIVAHSNNNIPRRPPSPEEALQTLKADCPRQIEPHYTVPSSTVSLPYPRLALLSPSPSPSRPTGTQSSSTSTIGKADGEQALRQPIPPSKQ
ncbi:hypothetical protein BDZ45DRAFT_750977 [Acephala macrosclerotiorum]|nr:hypothetical protein BDZ45DRAFT_750977 [Acephala macrosclerotiorum]